jgi:hypothetical protein
LTSAKQSRVDCGRVETKDQFLAHFASGVVGYDAIDSSPTSALIVGGLLVGTGTLTMSLTMGVNQRTTQLQFLSVWIKRGAHWRLSNWQYTAVTVDGTSKAAPWRQAGSTACRKHFW